MDHATYAMAPKVFEYSEQEHTGGRHQAQGDNIAWSWESGVYSAPARACAVVGFPAVASRGLGTVGTMVSWRNATVS
jgi:hypothetical protein